MKFSQNDEQDYICNYFNENEGFFLEIGAFDPKVFSNTRSLVERGWSGTYVEPSPICAEKFRIEYKENYKIDLIEAAVSDKDGFDTLYDCNGNAVSTTDINHKIKWEIGDIKFNKIQVKFISMESLLVKASCNSPISSLMRANRSLTAFGSSSKILSLGVISNDFGITSNARLNSRTF
jgi:FkbM family methyltransferase